jgi:colicin import membrane protein
MSTIFISSNKYATFTGPGHDGKASDRQLFVSFISLQGVSVLLHIGLLLVMIFMQQHTNFNKKLPPAVQVDLVSYSPKLGDLLKPEKKQVKKPVIKKKVKSVKKKVKPIKKNEKTFSEKKEPEPTEIAEPVKEDIEKKVEDPEQEKIKDILSELRDKVVEQEMEDDYEAEEANVTGYKAWNDISAQSIYSSVFTTMIQKNWVFNENLAQLDKDDISINVVVMIKILENGDLGDIWIETKSGNNFLDKSAIRAIKKAAPFPPLPKEFQRRSYEVGLRFSPKGLN